MLFADFGSNRLDHFVWPKCQYAALRWKNGDFELPTRIDVEARDHWVPRAVGTSFQNDRGPHHVGKT
jgi:hypothetical protein